MCACTHLGDVPKATSDLAQRNCHSAAISGTGKTRFKELSEHHKCQPGAASTTSPSLSASPVSGPPLPPEGICPAAAEGSRVSGQLPALP